MKKIALFLAVGLVLAAACSKPPEAPRNSASLTGPASDSIKLFFDAYAKGDWATMRAFYHDTAAVYHNQSVKMSPDSIIAFHTARRANYDKIEYVIHAPLSLDLLKDGKWRDAWGEYSFTIKGGETVKLPIQIAWLMANNKVVMELAYYNPGPLGTEIARVQALAAAPKK